MTEQLLNTKPEHPPKPRVAFFLFQADKQKELGGLTIEQNHATLREWRAMKLENSEAYQEYVKREEADRERYVAAMEEFTQNIKDYESRQKDFTQMFHQDSNMRESLLKLHDFTEEDIKCLFCQKDFFEPVSLVCGHTFCKACLTRNCKSGGYKSREPYLRNQGIFCIACNQVTQHSDIERMNPHPMLKKMMQKMVGSEEYNKRLVDMTKDKNIAKLVTWYNDVPEQYTMLFELTCQIAESCVLSMPVDQYIFNPDQIVNTIVTSELVTEMFPYPIEALVYYHFRRWLRRTDLGIQWCIYIISETKTVMVNTTYLKQKLFADVSSGAELSSEMREALMLIIILGYAGDQTQLIMQKIDNLLSVEEFGSFNQEMWLTLEDQDSVHTFRDYFTSIYDQIIAEPQLFAIYSTILATLIN